MRLTKIWVISIAVLFLAAAHGPAQERDFKKEAKAALDKEAWTDLEKIAREWHDEKPELPAPRGYLACALAGQHKFDQSAAELLALQEAGYPPTRSLRGLGKPMDKIINIIYMTCWANFSADYNHKAWSPLFNAFSDLDAVSLPASRLLMAALKKNDKKETKRLRTWFDQWLEKYSDNKMLLSRFKQNCMQGYIRAGVADASVIEMAVFCFQCEWEANEEGFKSIEDPLKLREQCDINTDSQHNNLALAYHLMKVYDPADNILAAEEAEPGAIFEDITDKAGFKGVRAGRVAAADYDKDGYPDLCFSGRLYKNMKGKKFKEVSKEAGVNKGGTGALFFDYDNDGDLDLLITAMPHSHLFRNKGKKGKYAFEDVTQAAGMDKLTVKGPPDGAAVFDMDNDGFLDLYLAAYENPYPVGHPDLLARNNGDGTFADVSEKSGILTVNPATGRGVTCSDFDVDGDTDFFVSNYRLLPNFFWKNDGKGNFINIAVENGTRGEEQKGSFGHTIGSCWGDVDNDGDFDLFCANLAHPRFIVQGFSNLSMLYVNQGADGGFSFADERLARGIRFQETLSDPAFADYDNDGDLDLYITSIYEGVPTVFYQNDGNGFFQPITFRARSVTFHGWGQSWFDMDGDGDLDHLICSSSGVTLHRNKGNKNKWLKVKLRGKKPWNLFGVGSRVKVTTGEGLSMVREVRIGRGTQSQDDLVLHFGLGPKAATAQVEVTWPTGHTSSLKGKVNRIVEVRQVKTWMKK